MPKFSELLQSKYLRKEDVPAPIVVTIKTVEVETMPGDAGEQRPVAYFREMAKGLVLNVTALNFLGDAFGRVASEEWSGERVTLFTDTRVEYKGKRVGGLRLSEAPAAPAAAPQSRPKAGAGKAVPPSEESNDSIAY